VFYLEEFREAAVIDSRGDAARHQTASMEETEIEVLKVVSLRDMRTLRQITTEKVSIDF
jgi:hypothetical protein